ncbi:MAG TPA: serine/threonine-protein kinase, partial [Polyangia bacterium]
MPTTSSPSLLAGRYELQGPLGTGATGTTRRGRRVADGLAVAVKERRVLGLTSFREAERLQREAELLGRLEHPGVPRLVEHFLLEDGPGSAWYVVTELVAGRTLADELAGRAPDWREVLRDVAGILDVLAYLHGRSPAVVHGDLTPDNLVRRDDGTIVLLDFHAAQTFPAARAPGLTTAVGTPGYMAPEQLTGYAEPATDVYAAGCVALALLTRRPLHTLVDEHHRLAWRDAVAVPAAVRRFLGRLLHPSPARRGSAGALAAEARALAGGRARPVRRWAAAGGASVLLAVAAALWARTPASRAAPPPEPPAPSAPLMSAAPPPATAVRYPDVPG